MFLPNGDAPRTGDIFRQPDLARTLRAMAAAEKKALAAGATRVKAIEAVRDYFYRGEIAHKIDEFMKANGGLLRYEDMAAFHVAAGRSGLHHLPRLHGLQARLLEPGPGHDRDSEHPRRLRPVRQMGYNSADYIHTVVEALKLAYADRDTYYGDPKFTKIPADALLSKEYGAERAKLIGRRGLARFPARQRGAQPAQASLLSPT